ncbi:M48 family metallopeptidase [Nitrogeniibacter mangrovi]|uniref:M48 family metallopeptidase n=1 Tax=Nitrogeniibacter mangrovi TaxID=2016596 RepID=A0A6C1BAU3_9RHOO|nr:M48 family metallopeptidase [Nitrogeniibacter mangrovi]QID19818.1 M48 family metallopeptidase [Nitrogeniibacter mangrovi]
MRLVRMLALVAVAGFTVGCQTVQTTRAGAVGVTRGQSMLVSEQDIETASAKAYAQVLQEAKAKGTLNRNKAQVSRVRGIASRLIPQTGVFRKDALAWNWEVNVITSDQLNAWCMAGGKIAVYTGLIDKLKLSDAEIAVVMGHEIAHALREHSRERASQQMVTNIGLSVLSAAVGLGQGGADLMGAVAKVTFELPNSRLHETEADSLGVELAARAGYDPRAAVGLWQKMEQHSNGAPPQWLSTHPSYATRQQDLARDAQRVLPLYEAAHKR